MHSGTKYFGGHSDMLCGVLAVSPISRPKKVFEDAYWELYRERLHLGSVMGSFEGWLGVRSLRTLELRVLRQSASAGELVRWLNACLTNPASQDGNITDDDASLIRATISTLNHASLQTTDIASGWLPAQMPRGYGPVFSILMRNASFARRLPSKLRLFQHATSLGGVESLIEWRRMSDAGVDDRLVRVSVGVEDVGDLKEDLREGFRALVEEMREQGKGQKEDGS